MRDDPGPGLLLQYLEPSPVVDVAEPARLADHLRDAIARLPVTDLALGWRLRPEVIEAIRAVVPDRIILWRWVPVFVDSGMSRPADAHVATGPEGEAPPPFRGMADFRFLCLDHDEVVEAGLVHAVELAREVDADGVLLDRIRWHSPSLSPAAELTCFCLRSREAAARDGLDLGRVASDVVAAADSLAGRRALAGALLSEPRTGALAEFIEWRQERVTVVVRRLTEDLADLGLRSALDVFTPALARSVGQDLSALATLGEWSKSMTYLDAFGPASMPFELRGYAAWLEQAGETDAAGFLAGLLGFDPPGLTGTGPQLDALRMESTRLEGSVGSGRSIVGIDAVEIPGVCDVASDDLDARVIAIREAGLGLSPSWELLAISEERTRRIALAGCGGAEITHQP